MWNDFNTLIGFEIELKISIPHFYYLLTRLTI